MSNIIEEKLGIDLSKADGETRGFLRGLVVEVTNKHMHM